MFVSHWLFHDRCYRIKKNKGKFTNTMYIFFIILKKYVVSFVLYLKGVKIPQKQSNTVNLGRSDNTIVKKKRQKDKYCSTQNYLKTKYSAT